MICKDCRQSFPSVQALGGHYRRSHAPKPIPLPPPSERIIAGGSSELMPPIQPGFRGIELGEMTAAQGLPLHQAPNGYCYGKWTQAYLQCPECAMVGLFDIPSRSNTGYNRTCAKCGAITEASEWRVAPIPSRA